MTYLPSSDPKSTINPKNLPKTCGQCHPGAGERFAISQVHVSENGAEPAPLRFVRSTYLLLIPVTIGLMLLHNLGDWLRKLIRARFRNVARRSGPNGHPGLRMLPFERIQHAVMAISFVILVWSGFALEVPGPVVGSPPAGDGGYPLGAQPDSPRRRGRVHRGFRYPRGFARRKPQTAGTLEGNAAEPQRSARSHGQFRVQSGTGSHAAPAARRTAISRKPSTGP